MLQAMHPHVLCAHPLSVNTPHPHLKLRGRYDHYSRVRTSGRFRRGCVVQAGVKVSSDREGGELERQLNLPQQNVHSEVVPGFGRSLVASNTGAHVLGT
eukprot:1196323-Prorocentrum_minimum.AAC.8